MLISALRRYRSFFGDDFSVAHPTGSGEQHTLAEVADDLARRLIALFLDDADGRRPVFGAADRFQREGAWHELISFFEYFHGDTGMGLGASHQTGWTGLVIDLMLGNGPSG